MTTENDTLTPRPPLAREMTTWSYDAIEKLLDGDDEFAIYVNIADREAVLFHEADRLWLFTTYPRGGWVQVAPEVIEDWIGASAPKKLGSEPVLLHRDELPGRASDLPEHVLEQEPEHVYDELARTFDDA